MTVTMASRRAYLWQLIREREVTVSLLYVLDSDISIRRKLEELRKQEHAARHSVNVERAREELQHDLARLKLEIDAAIDLIARGSNEPE